MKRRLCNLDQAVGDPICRLSTLFMWVAVAFLILVATVAGMAGVASWWTAGGPY